jgi:ketosteroid isomerase-like protein
MNTETNVKVKRDSEMSLKEKLHHYVATMKSDFEGSLDLLADDIVWINLLPEHVPFGGTYTGKEEVVGYFMTMAETFVIGEYEWGVFEYIESGDTLVMVGFEKDGTAIPTGKVFDLHFVWVAKFNDAGQICYLREHNDTAAIGEAFK